MNKLSAIFNLFRRGEELSNAAAWTNRAAVANGILALAGLVVAFGYTKLNISADQAQELAGGLVALLTIVNGFLHVATDPRVGVPSGDPPNPQAGSTPGG